MVCRTRQPNCSRVGCRSGYDGQSGADRPQAIGAGTRGCAPRPRRYSKMKLSMIGIACATRLSKRAGFALRTLTIRMSPAPRSRKMSRTRARPTIAKVSPALPASVRKIAIGCVSPGHEVFHDGDRPTSSHLPWRPWIVISLGAPASSEGRVADPPDESVHRPGNGRQLFARATRVLRVGGVLPVQLDLVETVR